MKPQHQIDKNLADARNYHNKLVDMVEVSKIKDHDLRAVRAIKEIHDLWSHYSWGPLSTLMVLVKYGYVAKEDAKN